jgi:hypothetical protein
MGTIRTWVALLGQDLFDWLKPSKKEIGLCSPWLRVSTWLIALRALRPTKAWTEDRALLTSNASADRGAKTEGQAVAQRRRLLPFPGLALLRKVWHGLP